MLPRRFQVSQRDQGECVDGLYGWFNKALNIVSIRYDLKVLCYVQSNVIGHTPLTLQIEAIIARQDHHVLCNDTRARQSRNTTTMWTTKICCQQNATPSNSDVSREVSSNLASCLVTASSSCKSAGWRPAWWWLSLTCWLSSATGSN